MRERRGRTAPGPSAGVALRSSPRPPGRVRGHRAGATFGSVVVLLLVLLANPAAATSVHPVVTTLRPPFAGTSWSSATAIGGPCVGGYRVPVTPSFNASSGVFRGALNASVGSCGSQSASIRLEYWSVFQSSKQFKISSAGEYLVTVREAISYVLNLSATSGGTGESAFANGSVDSFGYLYNVSSGSEYSINQSEASFSLAERVGAGNLVSHARSFSITLANATTLPQGKYVAYLEWALVVSVWVSAAPVDASTAAADLNMGYSDRQASVESIGIP